jgi:nicotinamide-nucleotide amidase
MIVEVLNTGTELLLGEVVNTHAAWFGKQLFPLGLRISRQTTVPDGDAIRQALAESLARADIVLITGGLGPTTDDITREAVAGLLNIELVADDAIRRKIEAMVAARGYTMRERMLRQTMVPKGAVVLPNDNGTAPGLYLPMMSPPRSPHLFLLPGPPRELKPMFTASVLPLLRDLSGGQPTRECRVYRIVGLGESAVEESVGLALERRGDLEVGYCARPNEVDLRLIGTPEALNEVEPQILHAMGSHVFSQKGENLEEWVVARLRKLGRKIATAESCSGGLLAHRLTNVPGASEVFTHGFVTYANEAKISELGVPSALITVHGAVSEPVAMAMADGAREKSGADYSLSLTGIAGPGGGSDEKPVGLVFIALARRGRPTICKEFHFPRDRETFKQLATQSALDMLRHELI